MWVSLYPNMDKDHNINFEDFKNELIKPNLVNSVKTISTEDIKKEVEEIRKSKARKESKE